MPAQSSATTIRVSLALMLLATQTCYGDELPVQVDAGMSADAGDDAGARFSWKATPPERMIDLSASNASACGIARDGSIMCWAQTATSETSNSASRGIPAGVFGDISVAGYACAVRTSGELACWGGRTSYEGERVPWEPPPGKFVQVATGHRHACGIRLDGLVTCWGAGEALGQCGVLDADCGQAIPPKGRFTKVAVGDVHTCGIRDDGSVQCWGAGTKETAKCPVREDPEQSTPDFYECGQSRPPRGRFIDIASGDTKSCAVRDDGLLLCWGWEGWRSEPSMPLGAVQVVQVGGGLGATCGLTSRGEVVCSATLGFEKGAPPFKQIANGFSLFCGLELDGKVSCWRWLGDTGWESF